MTCGECHNAMARALLAGLPEGDVGKIVDIYGQDERARHKDERSYLFYMRYLPRLHELVWNHYRQIDPMHRYRGFAMSGVKRGADYVEAQIKDFGPDAIVCTHSEASNIVCWLKIHNKYQGKVYVIMHDYITCPWWEGSVLCDAVFTPHEIAHRCLLERGFREEQLVPTGFPVHPNFERLPSKAELRASLGIPADAFVVLCLNGGAGIGDTTGLVKALMRADLKGRELLIYAVCGRNESAKRKLDALCKKRGWKNVRVYGFVENVPEFMRIADLYFCRGGMGAFGEGMASGVNIVVREHPVSQEHHNRDILRAQGLCEGLKKLSQATEVLESYALDPQKGVAMQARVGEFFIRNGVRNIMDYVHTHA